jgi:hypothetical protein
MTLQPKTLVIQATDAGKLGSSALNACSRDSGVECSMFVQEIPRPNLPAGSQMKEDRPVCRAALFVAKRLDCVRFIAALAPDEPLAITAGHVPPERGAQAHAVQTLPRLSPDFTEMAAFCFPVIP